MGYLAWAELLIAAMISKQRIEMYTNCVSRARDRPSAQLLWCFLRQSTVAAMQTRRATFGFCAEARYNENRRYITHLPQWPLWLALRMYGYVRSQDCIKQYAAMAVADPNAGARSPIHVINDHAVCFPAWEGACICPSSFAVIMAL